MQQSLPDIDVDRITDKLLAQQITQILNFVEKQAEQIAKLTTALEQANQEIARLKEVSREQKNNFLKPGQSFEKLDIVAYAMSDNDFAKIMREEQNKLFRENILLEH